MIIEIRIGIVVEGRRIELPPRLISERKPDPIVAPQLLRRDRFRRIRNDRARPVSFRSHRHARKVDLPFTDTDRTGDHLLICRVCAAVKHSAVGAPSHCGISRVATNWQLRGSDTIPSATPLSRSPHFSSTLAAIVSSCGTVNDALPYARTFHAFLNLQIA